MQISKLELEQAIEYFKNRNSFEVPVYDEPQFKTILKYYQIVYENWQECEKELKKFKIATTDLKPTSEYILKFEDRMGTPKENEMFSTEIVNECLEIINQARHTIQYYENLIGEHNEN